MLQKLIKDIAIRAKESSPFLACATTEQKNKALLSAAAELEKNIPAILKANVQDLAHITPGKPSSFTDRLTLNKDRIMLMAQGLKDIAAFQDPAGRVLSEWTVPSGLKIQRVTIPLGVLCVIFEARPNVCADAAALCLKAGSSVILRCGGDSFNSCTAIYECIKGGILQAGLPEGCVQLVPIKEHEAVDELLKQKDYIDVIIPRGGKKLIEKVSNGQIPTFKHLNGICHTYIHKDADIDMAARILVNAKLRRTSICGATETVLLDQDLGEANIAKILNTLSEKGCEIRVDETIKTFMNSLPAATEEDWGTEYLDAVISAKVVGGVKEAAAHIRRYGSDHTEAIITQNAEAAEEFLNTIGSAVVMHNTSTQFCDGGEFGMGAEIGIATGKLHARGPVGLEQLVTYKYKVYGNGQVRK